MRRRATRLWRRLGGSLALPCLLGSAAVALGTETPGIVCTATDEERTVTFVAPTPDFTLKPEESIHPQLKPAFKAQWSGFLKIQQAGTYRLILTDGKSVLGQQTLKSDRGLMPVNLTFERKPGIVEQQLWWESEFFRAEPVPWYAYVETNTPAEAEATRRIESGRRLVEDLNCTACHKADNELLRGRVGPDLSEAGSRLRKEWVFAWLANPRGYHANALMPSLPLTDQERADVATYLETLRGVEPAEAPVSSPDGEALYNRIGCAACHGTDAGSLAGTGSKYRSVAGLAKYLADPLACDASGRMPGMFLTTEEAVALAQYLMTLKNPAFERAVPPGDATRGKALAEGRGCFNCHVLRGGAAAATAGPLASLHGGAGCLGNGLDGKSPYFHLTEEERADVAAFLASPDVSPAPVQDVERWIAQFQCAACHAWRGPAGTDFGRDQQPPALTDAGNKLRRSWIEQELNTTNRDRPWLRARMPQFGEANVAGFLDGLAGAAGNTLGEGAIIDNPRVDLADEGMHYIGNDDEGLSCLTCHGFRGEMSHGDLHSPDLTTVDSRDRTDWLQRWLFAPSRIEPGTAMPDFFVTKPPQESEKIVHRLLQALAMGPKMPDPPGWHGDPRAYFIVVSNAPVVQRCFLPDCSPRAIAVGLPGGVSYAFDAASCQLRYAWRGDFLDAKPTWTWRGGLPPRVLGKKFYVAPSAGGVRFEGHSAAAEFRGYDLENGNPRFSYELGGATVLLLITQDKNDLLCAYEILHGKDAALFNGGPEAMVIADPPPERESDGAWKVGAGEDVHFSARIPIR